MLPGQGQQHLFLRAPRHNALSTSELTIFACVRAFGAYALTCQMQWEQTFYLAVHLSTFCTTELALVSNVIIAFQDELIMSFKFPTVRRVGYSHTVDEIW